LNALAVRLPHSWNLIFLIAEAVNSAPRDISAPHHPGGGFIFIQNCVKEVPAVFRPKRHPAVYKIGKKEKVSHAVATV